MTIAIGAPMIIMKKVMAWAQALSLNARRMLSLPYSKPQSSADELKIYISSLKAKIQSEVCEWHREVSCSPQHYAGAPDGEADGGPSLATALPSSPAEFADVTIPFSVIGKR